MGEFIIFLLIIYAVYIDAKNLRAEDESLYAKIVNAKPYQWVMLVFVFFLFAIPIYLLRRKKLLKKLNIQDTPEIAPQLKNPNLLLITEFTGLIITWSFLANFALLTMRMFIPRQDFVRNTMFFSLMGGLLIDAILIGLMYIAIKKYHRGGFWANISFKKIDGLMLKGILLPALLGICFAYLSFMITKNTIPVPSPLRNALAHGTPISLLLFVATSTLIAPFVEEIFFRGYFYSFMSKLKGRLYAIIFVASVFTIAHLDQLWGDWVNLMTIFIIGLCITYLRARSGSIIPAISAHYSYNIALIVIPVLYLFVSNPSYLKIVTMRNKMDGAEQERLLKETIRKKPKFSEAYNELSWLYATEGKELDTALRLIEAALKMEPNNPAYLDTKAEVLYKLGRYDEAIAIETSLAKKFPSDPFYAKQLKKYKDAKKRGVRHAPGSAK